MDASDWLTGLSACGGVQRSPELMFYLAGIRSCWRTQFSMAQNWKMRMKDPSPRGSSP